MLAEGMIALIRMYQRLAPAAVKDRCRFEPSCSEYAALAFERHGAMLGLWRAITRLLRCRPPNGGEDYP